METKPEQSTSSMPDQIRPHPDEHFIDTPELIEIEMLLVGEKCGLRDAIFADIPSALVRKEILSAIEGVLR